MSVWSKAENTWFLEHNGLVGMSEGCATREESWAPARQLTAPGSGSCCWWRGRDAVTAPALTTLDTWEGLEPLVLSSHVLLDMKTVPVKNYFRIVVFAYATVDKQSLPGLYFNDKLWMLQQVFFVLAWFLGYFPPSTKGNFYLRERKYRRWAASYLKSQHCLEEADRHESSQWMQHCTQVAFFYKHKVVKQGMRNTWSRLQFANVWLGSQVRVHSCRWAAVVMMLLPGKT